MTNNTALGALKQRAYTLERRIEVSTRERDRYQQTVDMHQKSIDEAVAEINSINAAIELLEAANDYSLMTAGDQAKEES